MDKHQKKITSLFMPHAMERLDELEKNEINFAHYTSAFAAIQIIENEEIWMRNAMVMNDFMEVRHGQDCIVASWHDAAIGGRLRKLLGNLDGDLEKSISDAFDANFDERAFQSYLLSVSEHGIKVATKTSMAGSRCGGHTGAIQT